MKCENTNSKLSIIAAFFLLIVSCASSNAQDENKLGLRFYGSFLYTEKVPNALFFFNDIEKNDSFELRKALRNHDIDTLVLSSQGGSVWEGLNMAGIIYDKELITYVPKLGLNGEGKCSSACAFMFFAGNTRIADGQLGVHQFYSGSASETEKIGTTQKVAQFTVSEIIGFLNEYNTPPFVYERMFQQSEMYYFSDEEMAQIVRNNNLMNHQKRNEIISFIIDFKSAIEAHYQQKKVQEKLKKNEPTIINPPLKPKTVVEQKPSKKIFDEPKVIDVKTPPKKENPTSKITNEVDQITSKKFIKNSDWSGNVICNKNVNRSRFLNKNFKGELRDGLLTTIPNVFINQSRIRFEKDNLWYFTFFHKNSMVIWPLTMKNIDGQISGEYKGKLFRQTRDVCELRLIVSEG